MKHILLIFFTICLTEVVYSQINQTEAKAAYLLAEESYGKGDYKTALRYLELTKKSLGSSNSKMLYLWIQTEIEISKTEPGNNDKILALIDEFEKLSDVDSFSEEKVLEIAKIKLTLKTQLSDAKEKAQKEAKEKLLTEEVIKAYEKNLDFPLGSSLAELKVKHPDFAEDYKKRYVKRKEVGGKGVFNYKQMLLTFDHDVLIQIFEDKYLFNYIGSGSFVKGKAENKIILDDFISKYGNLPKPNIYTTSNIYSEIFRMEAHGTKLYLEFHYASDASFCILQFSANMIK